MPKQGHRGGAIAVIAGTRPEVIKLAPVVHALRRRTDRPVVVIGTGQHRQLFDLAASGSALTVDEDLDLIRPGQSPAQLLGRALPALHARLANLRPALVAVQGDTASAYAGAAAAARLGLAIAHVEAGLRTGELGDPFPEELFRRAITPLAALHFAPTDRAAGALASEGIAPLTIHVTGNSGIDGLASVTPDHEAAEALIAAPAAWPYILATVHRRESQGPRLSRIAEGLARTMATVGGTMILPLHPSPGVLPLARRLAEIPGIRIVDPLPHAVIRALLDRVQLVMTDSGGLLEEAATLGVPTVILRAVSERQEAVAAGRARFAIESPDAILAAARLMLANGRQPRCTLFGDGKAAPRIADAIANFLADTQQRIVR